jgi:hypothetical protein
MKKLVLGAAMAALLFAPAAANDSTAELATGGLILKKTDSIEMRSEDLFISTEEVRVSYRFLNTSGSDVTTVVAFPMPDIGGEGFFNSDVGIPDMAAPANILDFRTTVDGKAVKAEVEQKAMVGTVDHSAWLKARKIPLAPQLDATTRALDGLSAADKAEAKRLGLVIVDEYDAGKGWESHLAPVWVLKTTFYWTQTFPAGREVRIDHRYKPSVGGSVDTIVGTEMWDKNTEGWAADMKRRHCIEPSFAAGVAKRRAGAAYSGFQEQRVSYVLKTGANWAKPIGEFRLVIDKGAADNLVSFCASGVKKISPTQFEVRKTNFTPTDDLHILILVPHRPVAD